MNVYETAQQQEKPQQAVQVTLNFGLLSSTATSNGEQLIDPSPADPDINLRVSKRDTLEFVSDDSFRIEIKPLNHNDIPAGPSGNPFEKSDTDSQLQPDGERQRHKVDRGAVRSDFQTDEKGRAYKYIATLKTDPNKKIDPHIIIRR
jgi:hypothetical protein